MIRQYIDWKIDKTVADQFRTTATARNFQTTSNQCGWAKVVGFKDGFYQVELGDGSQINVIPSGSRGVGPDGHIFLVGDTQVY